jgi:rubrerythrin
MNALHERMLTQITTERDRLLSRRGLLTGGAKAAAGGALVAAFSGAGIGRLAVAAQENSDEETMTFADDIEVLNYALTLEHLETAFYRDGIGQFTFGQGPFLESIDDAMAAIAEHEAAHVATLTQVITDLGGEPVEEATYDFGYTDARSFLATAAAVENLGVRAYDGAGAAISDPGLLTAAGSIVAVEARHAAYLNVINGAEPFPEAFEDPATPDEVLEIAGPFITA